MLQVNQVRRLSPLEGKRLEQARERGYLVAHDVNSEKHKRVSNAWWQICEDEGRYFVRVDVSRNGRAAHIYVDSGTVDSVLPLVIRNQIEEIFRTHMREGSTLFGEKATRTLYNLDPKIVDELAENIVETYCGSCRVAHGFGASRGGAR